MKQYVDPGFECPRCKNDGVDELEWLNENHVQCLLCGYVYEP